MQGGWTALHKAADEGDEAAAEAAIAADPSSLEARTAGYRETPLHLAAGAGHANVLLVLLNANADVNAQRGGGFSALHLAQTEAGAFEFASDARPPIRPLTPSVHAAATVARHLLDYGASKEVAAKVRLPQHRRCPLLGAVRC